MGNQERLAIVWLTAIAGAVAIALTWALYFSYGATRSRAERNADVPRLLELAGTPRFDYFQRRSAFLSAFDLIEEKNLQSEELDTQISDLRTKITQGLSGYGSSQIREEFDKGLRRLNDPYVDAIAWELVREIEPHLIPRIRLDDVPTFEAPECVDLLLSLWRNPNTGEFQLRPPEELRYRDGIRGFNRLRAYDGGTRTEIDNHRKQVRRLGVQVRSVSKVGFYKNVPWSLSSKSCKSTAAYRQVFDLYVVDLERERVVARSLGLLGDPPPGSTSECGDVGRLPEGYYGFFVSTDSPDYSWKCSDSR